MTEEEERIELSHIWIIDSVSALIISLRWTKHSLREDNQAKVRRVCWKKLTLRYDNLQLQNKVTDWGKDQVKRK